MKTRFASAAALFVAAVNALKYGEEDVYFRDGEKWRNQWDNEAYFSLENAYDFYWDG